MRAVVQRVSQGNVEVEGQITGLIKCGLLVYLGVGVGDTVRDAQFMAEKIVGLRIFPDSDGKMNLSVTEVDGSVLLVSQFTLYGDCRKGRRPGFDNAAEPGLAQELYQHVITLIKNQGVEVATGRFATHMRVSSINDGPVTLLLDSNKQF